MGDTDREGALQAIGLRIRQRRRELNITQERLAELANLSKSFVSELEGGSTAANGLVYLGVAQALGVQVQWLLTGAVAESIEPQITPVTIPPLLSKIAEEKGWSHRKTMDIGAALQGIVARRTQNGDAWEPTRELILKIAKALGDRDRP